MPSLADVHAETERTLSCKTRDLGRLRYAEALEIQHESVELRKSGAISDQLIFVEHPHVVTMGRNGHHENLLAPPELLARSGIEFFQTDRGGDVTYHGPGQIVGYPILDLREWKRDVHAYVRAIEQVIIDTLSGFGIEAGREAGATGVWTREGKIAAIGVHISRWVTSHGFALNVDTDLRLFPVHRTVRFAKASRLDAKPGEPGGARGSSFSTHTQFRTRFNERQMENL